MASLRKLLGQTAIYGFTHVLGRVLNFALTPLYTYTFTDAESLAPVWLFYAYIGFITIVLQHAMAIAFFRFAGKDNQDKDVVFGTALCSVLAISLFAGVGLSLFSQEIAAFAGQPGKGSWVRILGWVLALDAIAYLPLARLRFDERPISFAGIQISEIITNLSLNIFFLGFCKPAYESGGNEFLASFYNPSIGVGYIFISNLVASSIKMLLVLPVIRRIRLAFSKDLWKQMFAYAFPLVIVGFAGMINELLDRVVLTHLLPFDLATNNYYLGLYGANYKLAMFMALLIQAFRYAADPYFLSKPGDRSTHPLIAQSLTIFIALGGFVFLGITLFMPVVRHFIAPEYWPGLYIVPILLYANLFLGVVVNLGIWYKISDKTWLGAYITLFGAAVTIGANLFLVPRIGMVGAAWSTALSYGCIAVLSASIGRRYLPIPYQWGRLTVYLMLPLIIYGLVTYLVGGQMGDIFRYAEAPSFWPLALVGVVAYGALTVFLERSTLARLFKSSPTNG